MITREAGEFWKECQMPLRRRDACDAVAQRFETSSAPCFETVRDLLEHPSRGLGFGEFGEGYEIEEAEEDGECVYEHAGEARAADAEELADAQRMLEEVAPTAEIVALAAEAADPEEAFWLRRGSSPQGAGFQASVRERAGPSRGTPQGGLPGGGFQLPGRRVLGCIAQRAWEAPATAGAVLS